MTTTIAEVVRVAPDGGRAQITLPEEAGVLNWHARTRIAGPRLMRDFDLAQAGQHLVVPRKIFPGGRTEVFRRNGFDLVLYEAADRSDSCLVWAGPYNEATTWFGAPAPRTAVLNRLVSSVSFTDTPEGALLSPAGATAAEQFSSQIYGENDNLLITIRDARAARQSVPEWRGAQQGDAEVWKEELDLDPEQKAGLAGTPYEWRYIYANATAVFEVVLRKRAVAGEQRSAAAEDRATAVLSGLRVAWTA
ncbi:hypothetical protein [Nonomuraea africana]|uniref:Uncharacterized protein n=1 Tax=Nonomuraea africana TaxID=46171 RepID=A0ABR9K9S6_9ACTN|nr:hypothetical protein [Nonomuraea africana]MBE1558768.1 hypothetical protein [Nonomuraea africana]